MLRLLYKPVAIVAGIVSGLLSGLIFNRVWKIVGRGSDACADGIGARLGGDPAGRRSARAIYALVKTAVDRGAAEWTRKKTGIWPGGTLQQPGKSPDLTKRKSPSMWPGDPGMGRSQLTAAALGGRADGRRKGPTRQGRLRSQGQPASVEGAWFMYTRRRPRQNPSVPGFGSGWVGRRSGRVHSDGAQAGKGAAGVPGQLGDDGGSRRRAVRNRGVDDTSARAFDTSFAGRGRRFRAGSPLYR